MKREKLEKHNNAESLTDPSTYSNQCHLLKDILEVLIWLKLRFALSWYYNFLVVFYGTITDPRQTNTRHDKP